MSLSGAGLWLAAGVRIGIGVNLLPVIERELRAEARHPATHWVRPMSALAMLIASVFVWAENRNGPLSGQDLFLTLHQFLFVSIWLLVPLIVADCVSREKREQTLGLLFLTPLKAREILVAKTLVHGLRAGTVCVAAIPLLGLPLLIGGVTGSTVTMSLLVNSSAFFWAIAAGLLASILSRTVYGAMIWALIWSALFLLVLSMLNGLAVNEVVSAAAGRGRQLPSSEWLAGIGLLALWNTGQTLDGMLRTTPLSMHSLWTMAGSVILLVSFGGLTVVWQLGAWWLKQSWMERPPSKRREKIERQWLTPRFGKRQLRNTMRRLMERNPVGWLERRRLTSRIASWGWLALVCTVYSIIFLSFSEFRNLSEWNGLLGVGLIGVIAMTAAASLRYERESGVLELLLTTPLTVLQIVRGRLLGIWRQFLPSLIAFAILTGSISWTGNFSAEGLMEELAYGLWIVTSSFLTLSVAGVGFSLWTRHYVPGLLLTIGVFGIMPFAVAVTLMGLHCRVGDGPTASSLLAVIVILSSLGFGGWGIWQLRSTLGRLGAGFLLAVLITGGGTAWIKTGCGNLLLPGQPGRVIGHYHDWALYVALPGVQFALAGMVHRRLLSNLRQRTFAFKV